MQGFGVSRDSRTAGLALGSWKCAPLAAATLALAAVPVIAHAGAGSGVCAKTAQLAFKACGAEARDDLLIATAICNNLSDGGERRVCIAEAREEGADFRELCDEQLEARLEVCNLVGHGPYDPDFDPFNYEPGGNAYFPLAVGNGWVYASTFEDEEGDGVTETITVRVLEEADNPGSFASKDITGVHCLVVNDLVEEDGEVIEDTDDW